MDDPRGLVVSGARSQAILGFILQALYPLFGITAVMGFIINLVLIDRTLNTVYHSQIKWQQWTFIIGAFAYLLGWFFYRETGQIWLLGAACALVLYRLFISLQHLINKQEITRRA
ncbi:MAG: hypothetical protein KTR35_01910 [Gammaproteobacteria bacterium]|nr:hypothetical protein [Gammaproteobacteria bacterium]